MNTALTQALQMALAGGARLAGGVVDVEALLDQSQEQKDLSPTSARNLPLSSVLSSTSSPMLCFIILLRMRQPSAIAAVFRRHAMAEAKQKKQHDQD